MKPYPAILIAGLVIHDGKESKVAQFVIDYDYDVTYEDYLGVDEEGNEVYEDAYDRESDTAVIEADSEAEARQKFYETIALDYEDAYVWNIEEER